MATGLFIYGKLIIYFVIISLPSAVNYRVDVGPTAPTCGQTLMLSVLEQHDEDNSVRME